MSELEEKPMTKKEAVSFLVVVVQAIYDYTAKPIITIWAVNLLFSIGIPYTFTAWFATLVIMHIPSELRGAK